MRIMTVVRPGFSTVSRLAAHLVIASALAALACGCMKTSVQRIARFEPGRQPVQRHARATSVYKVRYADVAGGKMKTVPGSGRLVSEGEPLGFREAEDGTVIAVAGDEEFPLQAPPGRVRYCVWYRRWKEPRQFAKEVGRLAQGTAEATGYLAGKTLEAGVNAALNSGGDDDDDCDRDDDAGPWNWGGGGHDHHSHHHGGGGGNGGGSKPSKPHPKPGDDDGDSQKSARVTPRNP